MKAMLACDWDETKVKFPCIVQPKIDGVRAWNPDGTLKGRSNKPFGNRYITERFSLPELIGLDGEMTAESETHPALCRLTGSALRSYDGEPFVVWWLFDYVGPGWQNETYYNRYSKLSDIIDNFDSPISVHLRLMPHRLVNNIEALLQYEQECLNRGFEGICGRDPNGVVKQGRSTVREGGLWRIKRFVEDEAVVINIKEGQRNENEAQINELGRTFRSTHQENMVPNGQVGTLVCEHKTDGLINVSPGEMDVDARKMYFAQPHLILQKTITFKKFPKGVKDKPRFPTFKCIRDDI